MKKILLTIMIALTALPLFGQLKTKSSNKIDNLGSVRMGVITVLQSNIGISMGMTTDNRFDNPGIFVLGEDKDSAIQTLNDLIGILEGEETVTVECAPSHECDLMPKKQLGVKTLYFYFDSCAGKQNVTRQELEKVIDIIEKKAK